MRDTMMPIRPEVIPFIIAVVLVFGMLAIVLRMRKYPAWRSFWFCTTPAMVCTAYLLFFFRDPERTPPEDRTDIIVSGADGRVTSIARMREKTCLKTDCVRISIFLSLLDVHVNRAPISGQSVFLGYFPGKRLFTIKEKSSEVNQHNKILITNEQTRCLVCQIVGPICRRVTYWPDHDHATDVTLGERIGMMKFGSRLDMYFPDSDIDVLVKPWEIVRAGETIVARLKNNPANASHETAH